MLGVGGRIAGKVAHFCEFLAQRLLRLTRQSLVVDEAVAHADGSPTASHHGFNRPVLSVPFQGFGNIPARKCQRTDLRCQT